MQITTLVYREKVHLSVFPPFQTLAKMQGFLLFYKMLLFI